MVPAKKNETKQTVDAFTAVSKKLGRTIAQTFLYVSQHEGLAQSEIAKAIGISQPSIARHLKALGTNKYMYKNNDNPEVVKQGLGLLEVRHEHASFDVRAPYYLTDKGRKLLAGVDLL